MQKYNELQQFTWNQQKGLTHDAWRFYHKNGFLVVNHFVAEQTCQKLKKQAFKIAQDQQQQETVVFSTTHRQHDKSRYFMESANDIRCFYEELAVAKDGALTKQKQQAINKIGHALHRFDPVFKQFVEGNSIKQLISQLPLVSPKMIQSMVIFKQPYIGGEVGCHQDATFLYTEPSSVIGLWFALEDATVDNGCLHAIPGGHQQGLAMRYCNQNGEMQMVELQNIQWELNAAIPLEVKQGSLIILHGLLPHFSEQNYSSRSRLALTFHLIDTQCNYLADNWLQSV
ncbi:phytanoyl-CoA dioxygenase family protein [Spartinivicinus ruber]|uniref:phytanoyl-CoA dioxygenase family protein n=1 Tax=Spartinivicinus ruber TaxID=2683272 RepID=UPI0013D033DA|nr:phytanoyl-CoA dioxygenase family protein [Spartinivicinus ruber]